MKENKIGSSSTTKDQAKISSKEIMEIIKCCGKLGVTSIKINSLGLDVSFSGEPHINNRIKKMTPDQLDQIDKSDKSENAVSREMMLSQMDIENPHMYEQILLNEGEKEFVNAKNPEQRRT